MPAGRPRRHPRDATRISELPSNMPSAVIDLLPHVLSVRKTRLKTKPLRVPKWTLELEQRKTDGVVQWAPPTPSKALTVPTPAAPHYASSEPAYVPVPGMPGRHLPPGPIPLPAGDGLLVSRGRQEHLAAGNVLMDTMHSSRAKPKDRLKAALIARTTKHPTPQAWEAAAILARESDMAKLTRDELLDYVAACDIARAERLGMLLLRITPEMETAGVITIDLTAWSDRKARREDQSGPAVFADEA